MYHFSVPPSPTLQLSHANSVAPINKHATLQLALLLDLTMGFATCNAIARASTEYETFPRWVLPNLAAPPCGMIMEICKGAEGAIHYLKNNISRSHFQMKLELDDKV